jgi:hypothetical protein
MKALDCEPSDVFKPQLFTANELLSHWVAPPLADAMRLGGRLLPPAARGALSGWSFVAAPMQIHAAVLAVFASFVAPFGEGRGVAPPTTRAHSRAGARPRAEGAGPSCGFGLGHRPALTRPAPRAPPHAPRPTRPAPRAPPHAPAPRRAAPRRRLLRERLQARLQDEGLWRHHPGPWRRHRPLRLPNDHGHVCLPLLLDLRRPDGARRRCACWLRRGAGRWARGPPRLRSTGCLARASHL